MTTEVRNSLTKLNEDLDMVRRESAMQEKRKQNLIKLNDSLASNTQAFFHKRSGQREAAKIALNTTKVSIEPISIGSKSTPGSYSHMKLPL